MKAEEQVLEDAKSMEHRILNRLGYFPDPYELYEGPNQLLQFDERRALKTQRDAEIWPRRRGGRSVP